MRTYDVEVTREGRWWMIAIPDLDGLTQARRVDEIEEMARSYIAVDTDVPLTEIAVRVVKIAVADLGDVASEATEIVRIHREADDLEKIAVRRSKEYAQALTEHDVPVRDIATLLAITHQRVSQLAPGAEKKQPPAKRRPAKAPARRVKTPAGAR